LKGRVRHYPFGDSKVEKWDQSRQRLGRPGWPVSKPLNGRMSIRRKPASAPDLAAGNQQSCLSTRPKNNQPATLSSRQHRSLTRFAGFSGGTPLASI